MRSAIVASLLLAAVVFAVHHAEAREACLEYDRAQEFIGPVVPIDAKRKGKTIRYWVLRLPRTICVDGGRSREDRPEANVRELQLAFAEGSPYYGIYKSTVDGRTKFRVTGTLTHSRAAKPVRRVALKVEDFVPRTSATPGAR